MRITIQGETIEQHFGLRGIAVMTLERYTSAVLQTTLDPPKGGCARLSQAQCGFREQRLSRSGASAWRRCRLSAAKYVSLLATCRQLTPSLAIGCQAYKSYVFEHKQFVEFFRAATPVDELGALNIGSRPSRRKKVRAKLHRCVLPHRANLR